VLLGEDSSDETMQTALAPRSRRHALTD
jgi:hypothetical protein